MTSKKQELEQRLNREFEICDRHIQRIEEALGELADLLPMSVEDYVGLNSEQIRCLDQFIFRFSKLQDAMGAKIFRNLLEYLDEDVSSLPMRDLLNLLERYRLIDKAEEWIYIRELRNEIAHDYPLLENDVVSIYLKEDLYNKFHENYQVKPVKSNMNILYEDDNVCIVNKPKGLLVHGDEGEKRITLQNIFVNYLIKKGEFDPKNQTGFLPGPVHRLDRNTSGIVIMGKNLPTMQALFELFREKEHIEKSYWALVKGDDIPTSGKIDKPLMKDSTKGKVKVGRIEQGAKKALTEYKVVKRYSGFSLVEAKLITGRTHQLRVHFASIGHPIVGDGKYGDFLVNAEFDSLYGLKNQFLHARTFEFLDLEGILSYLSYKKIVAPLPEIEQKILDGLKA